MGGCGILVTVMLSASSVSAQSAVEHTWVRRRSGYRKGHGRLKKEICKAGKGFSMVKDRRGEGERICDPGLEYPLGLRVKEFTPASGGTGTARPIWCGKSDAQASGEATMSTWNIKPEGNMVRKKARGLANIMLAAVMMLAFVG